MFILFSISLRCITTSISTQHFPITSYRFSRPTTPTPSDRALRDGPGRRRQDKLRIKTPSSWLAQTLPTPSNPPKTRSPPLILRNQSQSLISTMGPGLVTCPQMNRPSTATTTAGAPISYISTSITTPSSPPATMSMLIPRGLCHLKFHR